MGIVSRQFGARLRALRKKCGISQEELAHRSSISPAHLGQIERGLKSPTVETVSQISNALDIPIAELFSDVSPSETSLNSTMQKILGQLIKMPENQQNDILKIIRIFKKSGGKSDSEPCQK